ncbi:tRNA 4-thiouridine(8) synthase ThiI [Candidatus Woesearchaeota archaeon]|nr:tRNA 4-thiouridine(8) synthase ThiI [Candidatus Woesearchaeota archaeon]
MQTPDIHTKAMHTIVIHYDEIAIKGRNRVNFESLLINNIRHKLKAQFHHAARDQGIITLHASGGEEKIIAALSKMPGIASFCFSTVCEKEEEAIKNIILKLLKENPAASFRIDARRRDKHNDLSSAELNKNLGAAVVAAYGKKVKLKGADLIVTVEIGTTTAYISTQQHASIGGLPTDRSQKVVCLLSGGMDSPVAAFMMMKRGCEVIFVHCMNETISSASSKDKVKQIAEQLAAFQQTTKLLLVPFEDIQKQIIMHVKPEYRMLVYRRMMLRIAAESAKQEGARFIVVGDSMSQVASQTFANLSATYPTAELPLLTPLIGMDKREIIDIARRIGTFPISALPAGDCCSFLIAEHPELHATRERIDAAEEPLDITTIVSRAVKEAEVERG